VPIYTHLKTGERVRAIPGSREDARLTASDQWKTGGDVPPAGESKRDTRTGRGTATVNLTGGES
jgi:hypothetical protein